MEINNNKEKYLSPEVDIFEVKTEGVICQIAGLEDYELQDPIEIL